MRIALISDIHANLHSLEAVFQDIQYQETEQVYCLGDLVGYGGSPNEVVEFIRKRRIPTILGNFDEAAGFDLMNPGCRVSSVQERLQVEEVFQWTRSVLSDANKSFLQTLPMQIRFKTGSKRILLVHGSPRRIDEYLTTDLPDATFEQVSRLAGCELLCVGHSHTPFHRRSGITSIINPGAVGIPAKGSMASYAVLDIGWRLQVSFRSVEYNVKLAAQALTLHGLPVPDAMKAAEPVHAVLPEAA